MALELSKYLEEVLDGLPKEHADAPLLLGVHKLVQAWLNRGDQLENIVEEEEINNPMLTDSIFYLKLGNRIENRLRQRKNKPMTSIAQLMAINGEKREAAIAYSYLGEKSQDEIDRALNSYLDEISKTYDPKVIEGWKKEVFWLERVGFHSGERRDIVDYFGVVTRKEFKALSREQLGAFVIDPRYSWSTTDREWLERIWNSA